MDQIKIGKFIADTRKEKNLTQRQLADALAISDKTVSKWECGKGLPEVSLMLPLCGILEITVNDLLTGARVSELEYQKKAEENMMDLMKENEENKKKAVLSVVCGLITIVAVCALIAGTVIKLSRTAIRKWWQAVLAVLGFVAAAVVNISTIYIVLATIAGAVLCFFFLHGRGKRA